MKKNLTASLAAACAGVLLTLGPGLPAQAEPAAPSFRLRLSGALNGQFHIPQVQWARVQSDPARTQASIGLFTDPPSDHLPFDLAVVLGDFRAAALQPGRYAVLQLATADGSRALQAEGDFRQSLD